MAIELLWGLYINRSTWKTVYRPFGSIGFHAAAGIPAFRVQRVKEVLPNKQKIVANSLLSQHGDVVDDLADIADIFNEHFSTVGERLVSNATSRGLVDDNIHLTRINSLEEKCTLPDITDEYVQKQISSMSVGKATGPDGISVNMLQIASRYTQKTGNTRWSHLFMKVEINVIQLTIALFPYCQLSPKSWSDGYIQ